MEKNQKPDLSVSLSGLTLDNPVIPASGTFGYGKEFKDIYDIEILGSFSFKGTTREPRFGNATPRIAECREGMINSVGLQNPGIDEVIARELPTLAEYFRKPVIANISGFSVEEYVECCRKIDACSQVGLIEVNISCPNVHGGGMTFGTQPELAAEVTRAAKAATTKPVYIKLSPNITDIVPIARACQEAGADGLRLNPGTIGTRDKVREVVRGAKERSIPIRIGVNAGSIEKDLRPARGGVTAAAMAESALRHIRILEDLDFRMIKVSLKASDLPRTLQAYRLLAKRTDYPFHAGITEAGTLLPGAVKSSAGLALLLAEGLADTIRVSLTAPAVEEVRVAYRILAARPEAAAKSTSPRSSVRFSALTSATMLSRLSMPISFPLISICLTVTLPGEMPPQMLQ